MRSGLLAILAVGLAACGGGGGDNAFIPAGGSSGGAGGGTATDALQIFIAGADSSTVGAIDIVDTTVEANGSTPIGVRLLDQNGDAYTATAPSVTFFTTQCSSSSQFSEPGGPAETTFTPNAAGFIRINWTDQGCNTGTTNQAVTLNARLDDNGTQRTASGVLSLAPVVVGSVLNSDPLSPVIISLDNDPSEQRPDFQVVRFKVVSDEGNPVQGKTVCFGLETFPSGATLTADSAVSDGQGFVTTTVNSGRVSGSVVVRASDLNGRTSCTDAEPSGTDSASNRQVIISSGRAVQDRFSVSPETFNIEGFDINGTTTQIRIDAADVFSNPIRSDESVLFQSSGASVGGTCSPVDGACAVTFKSQDSKPANGRVVVLAYVKGEEGFQDANGNGQFDDAEISTVQEPGEAYIDANESGAYESGELFKDEADASGFSNGVRDVGDGDYNGSTCDPAVGVHCSAKQTINVWKSVTILLARSNAEIVVTPNPINIPADGSVQVTIQVSGVMPDTTRQKMPKGTSVAVSTTTGQIVGNSTFTVENSAAPGPSIFTVTVEDSGDADNGNFTVKVTTPSGVETIETIAISQP